MEDAAGSSWLVDFLRSSGYVGVALLMFAETVLPPIPSEVVMPTVGFLAADGHLSMPGGIAAGTAGSVGGAYAWYLVARWIGAERLKRWADRHGRWMTVAPGDIDRMCRWFRRHGRVAVLVGRLVPGVRSLISVPAGIAPLPALTFLLWTAVGAGVWSGGLALAGYLLGKRYEDVGASIGLASNVVMAGAVLLYAWRVITFRPRP